MNQYLLYSDVHTFSHSVFVSPPNFLLSEVRSASKSKHLGIVVATGHFCILAHYKCPFIMIMIIINGFYWLDALAVVQPTVSKH